MGRARHIRQTKEHDGCVQRGPLVSVEERLVFGDVEGIRGGHLEEVFVKEISAEGCLRRRNGRLQGASISCPLGASEETNLIEMQGEYVFDGEELGIRFRHFASLRKVFS